MYQYCPSVCHTIQILLEFVTVIRPVLFVIDRHQCLGYPLVGDVLETSVPNHQNMNMRALMNICSVNTTIKTSFPNSLQNHSNKTPDSSNEVIQYETV